jgi:hypothetical protein
VSQLTNQDCIPTIHPYGISPEQKKNQEKLNVIAASIVVGLHNFSVFLVLQFLPKQDAPRQCSCAPVGAQAQAEQTI